MYAYFESKSVEIKFKEDSEYQIILYTTSNQTFIWTNYFLAFWFPIFVFCS